MAAAVARSGLGHFLHDASSPQARWAGRPRHRWLGRKSGAVVRRDAGSGPPDSAWARDWTGRLQTLLAEAAAQGMPATGIVRECEAALADFAFPAAAEAWQGSGRPP